MTLNEPIQPDRHSMRLQGYDYSLPGAYFVTLCTHNQKSLFGTISASIMQLNDFGRIIEYTWRDLPSHIKNIALGEYVIMPNHFHGIIQILGKKFITETPVGASLEPALQHTGLEGNHRETLSEIVRQLKTFSARRINEKRNTPGEPVWQRNYWDHVIRDEEEYHNIILYIKTNPAQWERDKFYFS